MKILGLDIGTNSIGWAFIDDQKHEIIKMGSRIFPIGVNEDNYNKTHKEVSKSVGRREARGARRLGFRYKLRRKQLKEILKQHNMFADTSENANEVYEWRANAMVQKVSLEELGTIFQHLNQRRGFKSSRKEELSSDEKAKETGVVKESIQELKVKMKKEGCQTMGEYFHFLLKRNQTAAEEQREMHRIRKQYTSRELYQEEFDLIWEKQQKYYPKILTVQLKKQIGNQCIFYQRPLKSQKNLLGRCQFEPNKRVCPKSAMLFQEFRYWQIINNLSVTTEEESFRPLTQTEKETLAEVLSEKKKMTIPQIKKLLFGKQKVDIEGMSDKEIKGNTTNAEMIKAFGKDFWNNLNETAQYKIWHTLLLAQDDTWLKNYALNNLGFTEEQTTAYLKIRLEQDYGSLSQKAIAPILAHMKNLGDNYAEACMKAGYHHSFDAEKEGKDRKLADKVAFLKPNELRNPIVQQCLSEVVRLTNAVITTYGKPDVIRIETARELKKPKEVRENMSRDMRNREERKKEYATFLSIYFKNPEITFRSPWVVKFQLWLELGIHEIENSPLEWKDFYKFLDFSRKIAPTDSQKFKHWLECNRMSPYSGNPISLYDLLGENSNIEIEHIIPYSKSMDNSFANKTLCESDINQRKGNKLPYEYFQQRPESEWLKFQQTIKSLPKHKQKRMLLKEIPDGFKESQLRNTSYIATETIKRLKTICHTVEATNGQATSLLRKKWALNKKLNQENVDVKNRGDHRHHAVDALVIALTNKSIIQKLSTANHKNGRINTDVFPNEPWDGFREQAWTAIDGIFISFRNKKRLLTSRSSWIKTAANNPNANAKGKIKTPPTVGVRGKLHEETYYGKIIFNQKGNSKVAFGETIYVKRKEVSAFTTAKELEKVLDETVRKTLIAHLEKYNGNCKKAFGAKEDQQEKILMPSKKGKRIEIKKVRIFEKNVSDSSVIQLKPKENEKLYVMSGNNFRMAIYEDPKTKKREHKIVTFFDAVHRKINNEPLLSAISDKGFPMLFEFTHKDMFLVYENHEDEIEWNNPSWLFYHLYKIVKFSQGKVFLALHHISELSVVENGKNISKWNALGKYATDNNNDNHYLKIQTSPNKLKAVKVKVDNLGNISKI